MDEFARLREKIQNASDYGDRYHLSYAEMDTVTLGLSYASEHMKVITARTRAAALERALKAMG